MARAPGRVNLIGEHTDYNDGFVLPMAINRHIVVAAAPNGLRRVRLRSTHGNGLVEIDLTRPLQPGEPRWANYVRGVIAGYQQHGFPVPGFDAGFVSSLPAGGGLSSSAALEVAAATAIEALAGESIKPVEKALLCQRAEHDFAGTPCGIMDQFASVFGREGHLLLIDCRSLEVRDVPWPGEALALLVINSGIHHELAAGEYALRRQQCQAAASALGLSLREATRHDLDAVPLDDLIFKRTRHVISENARTLECVTALEAGDWQTVGRLMLASHASLRDDFQVSCGELDTLVELAAAQGISAGVHGARMTGGGFGGSVIVLVDASEAPGIRDIIVDAYFARTGIRADAFITTPSEGARILSLE